MGEGGQKPRTPEPRTPEPRVFVAAADAAGERLDRFLARSCPDLSRARIQAALTAGRVAVDDRARPKSYRLRGGERIELTPLPREELTAVGQDIPLQIVHEDEAIAVIDKPAGLVVHPGPGHADGTLVNALVHRYGALETGGEALRPGIVHRLDRDTSGLLVVALTEAAHASLAGQLGERTLGRYYRALCWGRWPVGEGVLEGAVGRHPRDRRRMAVLPRGGRPARTRYAVRENFGFCQLCDVELETGRTHQIRVHFQHHGRPVVGDPVYGESQRAKQVAPEDRSLAGWLVRRVVRQFLHAAELHLDHPLTGERLVFQSPLPADLATVLDRLRERP